MVSDRKVNMPQTVNKAIQTTIESYILHLMIMHLASPCEKHIVIYQEWIESLMLVDGITNIKFNITYICAIPFYYSDLYY